MTFGTPGNIRVFNVRTLNVTTTPLYTESEIAYTHDEIRDYDEQKHG